jgi:hypothetical protein
MTDNRTDPAPQPAARRPWTPPAVHTMRAGDAEAGPTPVSQEGTFGSGS